MPLPLGPIPQVLDPIGLYLLAESLFKAVGPVPFVDDIVLSGKVFDDTVSFSFIVLEGAGIDVLSRDVLVAPSRLFALP